MRDWERRDFRPAEHVFIKELVFDPKRVLPICQREDFSWTLLTSMLKSCHFMKGECKFQPVPGSSHVAPVAKDPRKHSHLRERVSVFVTIGSQFQVFNRLVTIETTTGCLPVSCPIMPWTAQKEDIWGILVAYDLCYWRRIQTFPLKVYMSVRGSHFPTLSATALMLSMFGIIIKSTS